MRQLYLVFVFLFCFCQIIYAEMTINKIEMQDDKFTIVLNNALQISNITLSKKNGEFDIVFPVYASKGKIYIQFNIINRKFRNQLTEAIAKKEEQKEIVDTVFVINKFSLYRKKAKIKAFASVIFNDDIEVECRIMDGKNGLWVAWPSNKVGDKWHSNFKFIDRKTKNGVENLLIKEYTKKLNNEN